MLRTAIFCAAAASCSFLLVTASPGEVYNEIDETKEYRIFNRNTGQFVTHDFSNSDSSLVLRSLIDAPSRQEFTFNLWAPNEFNILMSPTHGWEINWWSDVGHDDGTILTLYTDLHAAAMQWSLEAASDGFCRIKSKYSNMMAEGRGGMNGTLVQGNASGTDVQEWMILPIRNTTACRKFTSYRAQKPTTAASLGNQKSNIYTVEDCAKECLFEMTCYSFSYLANVFLCQLSTGIPYSGAYTSVVGWAAYSIDY